MPRLSNIVGQKFGRWVVIANTARLNGRLAQLCRCDCGNFKHVLRQNLMGGKTTSCGCYGNRVCWKGHGEIPGAYWSRLKADARRTRKPKARSFEISIEYAWLLFLKQERRCALTGQVIIFASSVKGFALGEQTASLDRIDSNKDYTPGNVQWVHKDINRMKQNFNELRFIELCKLVIEHRGKREYS